MSRSDQVINAFGRQNENIKKLEILIQILNAAAAIVSSVEIVRVLLTHYRRPRPGAAAGRSLDLSWMIWSRPRSRPRSSFQFCCSLFCSWPRGTNAFNRQRRRQIEIKLNFTISLIISDDGLISFLNFYSCSHLIIPKLMLRSTKSREDKNESRAQIEELRITLLITRCFILDCIGIP